VKQLKAVTEKENITWRSFVDPGNAGAGPIAAKWNMSATPSFYLIDHKWAGPPGEKVMDAAIEKLVHAAEADGKKPQ
jgi:hypothetical protein